MKISSIGNNLSFKRVIPIKSDTNPLCQYKVNSNIDYSSGQILRILNNKKADLYTKKESEKIRHFFEKTLDDYTPEKGVLMLKLRDNSLILVTGNDKDEILRSQLVHNADRHAIKNNKNLDEVRKKQLLDETTKNFYYVVKKRLEDGTSNKPYTLIEFSSSKINPEILTPEQKSGKKPIIGKFDIIGYTYMTKEPSYISDGFLVDKENKSKKQIKKLSMAQNISCYSQILDLKFSN